MTTASHVPDIGPHDLITLTTAAELGIDDVFIDGLEGHPMLLDAIRLGEEMLTTLLKRGEELEARDDMPFLVEQILDGATVVVLTKPPEKPSRVPTVYELVIDVGSYGIDWLNEPELVALMSDMVANAFAIARDRRNADRVTATFGG